MADDEQDDLAQSPRDQFSRPDFVRAASRLMSASARGPLARRAVKNLVAGSTVDEVAAVSRPLIERGRRISWQPLVADANSGDAIITVKEIYLSAMRALAELGSEQPDVTVNIASFGVLEDDVSAGMFLSALRDLGQGARNAGVSLTLMIDEPGALEAIFVVAEELRQDFPEVGLSFSVRSRRAAIDIADQVEAVGRVRLNTERLDAQWATTSARECGTVFVDGAKALLNAGAATGFDTDDVLLLDIAASLAARFSDVPTEFVAPWGRVSSRHEELAATGHPLRIVLPFGPHPMPYVTRMLRARPSISLPVPRSVPGASRLGAPRGRSPQQ